MQPTPKTLQIFLPQGSPSGIRIAELTTRIVQAVACPRTGLASLFQRQEIGHIATYFLFGGSDEDSKPEAYVGQTEDLIGRLKAHDAKKEFWHTVVFLISRTHSFTQAHIRWMEWKNKDGVQIDQLRKQAAALVGFLSAFWKEAALILADMGDSTLEANARKPEVSRPAPAVESQRPPSKPLFSKPADTSDDGGVPSYRL